MLWLFVINLGVALGAGIYEARVELPQWIQELSDSRYLWNAAAAKASNSGMRFWAMVTTGPLTLITLINLYLSFKARGLTRKWWMSASGISLVERIFTFTYFIPTMIQLMEIQTSTFEAVQTALRWEDLNFLRHLLTGAALLAAMKAFSLVYQERH